MNRIKKFWNKNSKRIVCISILVAMLLSVLSTVLISVNANNTTEFYSQHDDELDQYFKFTKKDIPNVIEWITDRKTFTVVEVRDDGGETAWINAPNLQQYIWNELENYTNSGYETNVTDLDEETKNDFFNTDKNGNTAMKKWGFDIPSNVYTGEWPTIFFDASALFPTSSWWGSFKAAIRGSSSGNILNDISKSNFGSFYYKEMNDYVDGYYAYQVWIKENWDETIEHVIDNGEEDYPLLSKDFCGNNNGEFNGVYYTVQTCIIDADLEEVDCDPEEFEKKLRALWGSEFEEIMFNVISLNPEYSASDKDSSYDDTTKYPLRVMPYELDTLEDNVDNLAQDPRAEMARTWLPIPVHSNLTKKLFNSEWDVKITGGICKIAYILDSLCSLTWVNDNIGGLDIIAKNTVLVDAILGLVAVVFVIKTLIQGIEVLRGKKGPFMGLMFVLQSLIITFLIAALFTKNDTVVSTFEKMLDWGDNLATSFFFDDGDSPASSLIGSSATDKDKHAMIFWLPYYNTWCVYNTSHSYEEQDVAYGDPETEELEADDFPTIDGSPVEQWAPLLIKCFTEGEKLNKDAYRVVDHFMAPRVTIDDAEAAEVSSVQNENYTYDIQSITANCIFGVILLLVATIVKLIVYYCMIYNFIFLYVYCVRAFIVHNELEGGGVKECTNEFLILLKNFGLYLVTQFVQGMIAYYNTKMPIGSSNHWVYYMIFIIFIVIEIYLMLNPLRPKLLDQIDELNSF